MEGKEGTLALKLVSAPALSAGIAGASDAFSRAWCTTEHEDRVFKNCGGRAETSKRGRNWHIRKHVIVRGEKGGAPG